jgi:hypothetical protein
MSFNGNVGSDNNIPSHAAAKLEITSDILVGGRVVDSFPGQVFGRLVRTKRSNKFSQPHTASDHRAKNFKSS